MPSHTRGQNGFRANNVRSFRARLGLLLASTVQFGVGCHRTALLFRGDAASGGGRRDDSGAAPDSTEGLRLVAGHLGGDGWVDGLGAAARFFLPCGLASDGAGHLFVADENNTIRKGVIATSEVTTIAGSPGQTGSTDGTGAAASFNEPVGIASDGAGHLFVADSYNHAIRKVVVSTQAVTTVVGSPDRMGVVLGPLPARLDSPCALALGPSGELLLSDIGENVILAVRF